MALPRVVIDTNVVFEGLTFRGGQSGGVIDAWLAELFRPCISNALAYEYADVLSRKLSPERWRRTSPVLDALLDRAELVVMYYSWRPSSPDPGDEHVIDCGMNARAAIVTLNLRDFARARLALGLAVLTPAELLISLTYDQDSPDTRPRRP